MENWDDIRIFLAVARAGGLSGAATMAKLSPTSLGRRLHGLEQQLGTQLFHRERQGYQLTQAGLELLERAQGIEQSMQELQRWQEAQEPRPVVKIAAGAWTSRFIAQKLPQLLAKESPVRLELRTGVGLLDLSRRQAHLALRNQKPEQTGLAAQRLGVVDFAVYGSSNYLQNSSNDSLDDYFNRDCWIAFQPEGAQTPSSLWLQEKLSHHPYIVCSDSRAVLDGVLAGAGLAILPCFVGDAEERLQRVGETIPELQHHRYLVSHDDDRHLTHIKLVADSLREIFGC